MYCEIKFLIETSLELKLMINMTQKSDSNLIKT